ncbi:MAG: DUF4398 domain-containing protein [Candidatus Binataceae bacterium]|jgi:uncharacterized protein DUF4398
MRQFKDAAAGALAVLLAACANTPAVVPSEKIAVARAEVQRAEQSGAPEFAPVQMAAARDKLASAERAEARRDNQPAADLADQANVDALYAEASAQQQKSLKAEADFDANMQALRHETLRNSPPSQ